MITHKGLQSVFIILLSAFSISLYGANFINYAFLIYSQYILLIVTLFLSFQYINIEGKGFALPILLILFSTIASIIFAYITWGQGVGISIIATLPYTIWILFFYLIKVDFEVNKIEKLVAYFGVIYIIIFIFQFIYYKTPFFYQLREFDISRGTIRVSIKGMGFFVLLGFIALNRFTTAKQNKLIWLSLMIAALLIPYIQATRQHIVAVLLIYTYHFVRNKSIFNKLIYLLLFILIVYIIVYSNLTIFNELLEATVIQKEDYQNYIRYVSSKYFLLDFTPNTISRIFGNGVPYADQSIYAKTIISLQNKDHYFLSDSGLVSFYVLFGCFATFGYILIWIKSFKYSLPIKYLYLKYYLWFILLTSLTSDTMYNKNFLITTVFTIYIYHMVVIKPKTSLL